MSSPIEKPDLFATTALTLLQKESYLTSGCSKIDSALRGGFSRKGITQFYGQAGTGKTQIALQLCLTVQIPTKPQNEPSGAIYICTEAVFPSQRLNELLMKSHIAKKYYITGDIIFVEHVPIMEKLEECICVKVPFLMQRRKIGLLIIDSIAAPYRVEYDDKLLKTRAKSLRKIGEQLHSISREYNIPIICINQVSALINNESLGINENDEIPTLGIVWSNLINHSFHLSKNNNRRFMHFMHSSYLPKKTVEYEIRDIGVVGV
ncbi:DNA repair protein XRCC3-like [Leptopilina boulardi]|uniref:DNA repair protein XRCC3-like n=1 Tax=Leptopilina boulardi TaxID=63433 RepID=UPI0021F5A57E|nr:DNA repair protein XRCC3-like [Leptopilina boulardi]XP_051162779.1 DNA repair protein XRCC3-like [Leptopilina boulardi]